MYLISTLNIFYRNSSEGSTKTTSSSLDTVPQSPSSDDCSFFTPIPSHLYPCPALNCPKYLESDELVSHLTEMHNPIICR